MFINQWTGQNKRYYFKLLNSPPKQTLLEDSYFVIFMTLYHMYINYPFLVDADSFRFLFGAIDFIFNLPF